MAHESEDLFNPKKPSVSCTKLYILGGVLAVSLIGTGLLLYDFPIMYKFGEKMISEAIDVQRSAENAEVANARFDSYSSEGSSEEEFFVGTRVAKRTDREEPGPRYEFAVLGLRNTNSENDIIVLLNTTIRFEDQCFTISLIQRGGWEFKSGLVIWKNSFCKDFGGNGYHLVDYEPSKIDHD